MFIEMMLRYVGASARVMPLVCSRRSGVVVIEVDMLRALLLLLHYASAHAARRYAR